MPEDLQAKQSKLSISFLLHQLLTRDRPLIEAWGESDPSAVSSGGLGLDLLGSLAAAAVAILLLAVNVPDVSAAASAGGVSSLGLDTPVVSALLGVDAATRLGILLVLFVEIRPARETGNHMRVGVLLTSRRSTPSLRGSVKNESVLTMMDKNK